MYFCLFWIKQLKCLWTHWGVIVSLPVALRDSERDPKGEEVIQGAILDYMASVD